MDFRVTRVLYDPGILENELNNLGFSREANNANSKKLNLYPYRHGKSAFVTSGRTLKGPY